MGKKKRALVAKVEEQIVPQAVNPEPTEEPDLEGKCMAFGAMAPDSPECQSCNAEHSEEYEECLKASEVNQSKKEERKKGTGKSKKETTGTKLPSRFNSFAELKQRLGFYKAAQANVDKAFLNGDYPDEFLKIAAECCPAHIKNKSDLTKHLGFRKAKGWIFVEDKVGRIKLVGYGEDIDIRAKAAFFHEAEIIAEQVVRESIKAANEMARKS